MLAGVAVPGRADRRLVVAFLCESDDETLVILDFRRLSVAGLKSFV